MGVKPEQDIDLNGNKSNSYTREEARQKLNTENLSEADQAKLKNQTQLLRGDDFKKNRQPELTKDQKQSSQSNTVTSESIWAAIEKKREQSDSAQLQQQSEQRQDQRR